MKTSLKICSIILLFHLGQSLLYSQQSIDHFQIFNENNGLAKAIVSGVQDKQGFLWFGSEGNNGAYRYDGVIFQQFKHDPSDENSIVSGNIYSVISDSRGFLWFASDSGGLSRFDPLHSEFLNFFHSNEDDNSISDNAIYSLLEDKGGQIWIATAKSLDRYNPEKETFTHFYPQQDIPRSLTSSLIYHLYESRDGMIWISTYGGGLNMFNPHTEKFTVYKNDPENPDSLSHNTCGAVIEDKDGFIWVGGKRGLNRLDRTTDLFSHFNYDPENPDSIADDYIWDIHEDKRGILWLGGFGGGLARFDKDSGEIKRYRNIPNQTDSLSSDLIFFIMEDHTESLWIGTVDGGLNRYSMLNQQFTHYRKIPEDKNTFSTSSLFTIYQSSDETIWIGGQGHQSGLCSWDLENNKISHFLPEEGKEGRLPVGEVLSIFEDSRGKLLIGQFGGLTVFNREQGTFEKIFPTIEYADSFADKMVRNIVESNDGNLWLATEGGLVKKIRDKKEFEIFFGNTPLTSLFLDTDGELWIGTASSGAIKFNIYQETWVEYKHNNDIPESIGSGEISSIYKDRSNRIWIGTIGEGLNLLNTDGSGFTHFTDKDGFISNSIFSILQDSNEIIWMSTSEGIIALEYPSGIVRNFTVSDGLQGNEFSIRNDNAIIGKDGLFYFVGKNGLTRFNPIEIKSNLIPPKVVLTSVKIYNKHIETDVAPFALTDLVLSWKDSMISFNFAALDFSNPDQNQYAYKLEGFDTDWIESGNNRSATYTNLDGGSYIFCVKASNSHGVWNEDGYNLNLRIIPPWWKTNVFYGFFIIVILIFISLIIFYVLKLHNEISEHKISDRKLQKLQSDLTNIINSMPSIIIGIDNDNHVTQWNSMAEKRTGISAEEAINQNLEDVYPLMKESMTDILDSIKHRKISQTKLEFKSESGHKYFYNVIIFPLIFNTEVGAVIRVDDITEQVRIDEMMVQSEKMLSVGGLAAGMAHEINNPLGGLIQTANVMKNRLFKQLDNPLSLEAASEAGLSIEGIKKFMEKRKIPKMISSIDEAGHRISNIVSNMLSFARKDEGHSSKINLSILLDRTIDIAGTDYDLKRDYDFKNIEIIREYGEIMDILGEESKIQQVYLNILRNASQAMQDAEIVNPRIILRTFYEKGKNENIVEIEDNGPGIEDSILKHIFEPFFTTKPVGVGTGLGLSVSYFIITENLGGILEAQSELGVGTKIIIKLPVD